MDYRFSIGDGTNTIRDNHQLFISDIPCLFLLRLADMACEQNELLFELHLLALLRIDKAGDFIVRTLGTLQG